MSVAPGPPSRATTRRPGRHPARAVLVLSLSAGLVTAGVAVGAPARAVPLPSCVGFDSAAQPSTTGVMSCEVPAGVTALAAEVTGAGGGGGSGVRASGGGDGAVVTTTVAVLPGETLVLEVGTGGTARPAPNPAGGGGGGWSAVKRAGGTGVVVAGGGGGGGSAASGTTVAVGTVYSGGDGGTPDGTAGSPAGVAGAADSGAGGSASSPGAGGAGGTQPGSDGGFAGGGRGADTCPGGGSRGGSTWQGGTFWVGCGASTGGGGGSGLPGGGGGGSSGPGKDSGSGGGGSSYLAAGTATYGSATNGGGSSTDGGAGRIVLSAAPAPTVSGIAPTGGSTTGGSTVTVTGAHLRSGTTVTVGGQACAPVVVVSSTSLTCTTPAHAAGVVDVVLTLDGQTATLAGGFGYVVTAPGAPTGVTATAGTSSVSVSWTAPTSGGPVLRYEVRTTQGQAGCTTSATSCVLGAQAGTSYDVTVEAVGVAGSSPPASTTSGPVSAPVPPPTVPGGAAPTLTTDRGPVATVVAGQGLVLVGTGFAGSSTVTIVVYSSPTVLGTVVTDGAGGFSGPVTVPVSLTAGAHTLVASGVDPLGVTYALRMEVTVLLVGSPPVPAGPSALAVTGFSAATPLTLAGLLLVVGAGLLVGGRPARRGPRT